MDGLYLKAFQLQWIQTMMACLMIGKMRTALIKRILMIEIMLPTDGYTMLEKYLNGIVVMQNKLATPTYFYPANNESFENQDTITLKWWKTFGAQSYNFYCGESQENLSLKATDLASTFFKMENLETKTYYWRIEAVNDTNFTQGPVWSFTIEEEIPSAIALSRSTKGFLKIYPVPVKDIL